MDFVCEAKSFPVLNGQYQTGWSTSYKSLYASHQFFYCLLFILVFITAVISFSNFLEILSTLTEKRFLSQIFPI